jgi:hypothetical protein
MHVTINALLVTDLGFRPLEFLVEKKSHSRPLDYGGFLGLWIRVLE